MNLRDGGIYGGQELISQIEMLRFLRKLDFRDKTPRRIQVLQFRRETLSNSIESIKDVWDRVRFSVPSKWGQSEIWEEGQ